ncbi:MULTISPECIES: DUF2628 domain-containing protein [Bosea]|uniref:DUF2628 domain-containing protein n=1 Tax=Bosea TaxID=85413 RepID=UPI00215037C4|nr:MULTISPECIES: DUF2628 domain-containing protein [Bosea]MCR4521989.1 DUF2628 domain-containing protein [Bosea sp. 47.2.35]MDR6829533.1 hypothetical protein [Bosea robiniae]MDR6896416.1 hypothetical protein [Bosea sp. BE109]MDR7139814.1 hypothetical protein [Bosea sp. BE168]MDR7176464.1 hypothetical protein [Bosea sp. BE271]
MAFYTVMTPPPEGDRREEIEQARLIPESFAWGAFLIPGLWLLGKRLWLATLLVVLVWAVVIYLNSRFGLHATALGLIHWLIALFLGVEGNNLVASKLARKGWRASDVVEARNLAEAERRYFERALAGEAALPRVETAPAAPAARPSGPLPIIGLFPEAQGR